MGFRIWLRQTFTLPGMPTRPHRPNATERLRSRVTHLESQLLAVSQERDVGKVRIIQLERHEKELEETKHEQSIEIRKLQGDLEVEAEQVKRLSEVLVLYETQVKAATARASIDIARATQGRGGNLDAQLFGNRD